MSGEQDRPELPEEVRELADACSRKHVMVVQAILSGDYPNNTRAYLSVYPESSDDAARSSVAALLALPNVSALHKALRDLQLMEGALSRAEAVSILSDMARTSMGDLVTFGTYEGAKDESGEPVKQSVWSFKDSVEMSPAMLRSIAELNATREGLKIKQHDQKAAIKQLADLMGWDAPKRIKVGSLSATDESMSYEEAARIYEENLKDTRDDG